MKNISGAGGIDGRSAVIAFHREAYLYYKCAKDFKRPADFFSSVPYFLLCRAIELEIKSRHLKHMTLPEVTKYKHHLAKAYNDLDLIEKILNQNEECILQKISEIYKKTGFAYFNPENALTAYRNFPDLKDLNSIAIKLIGVKVENRFLRQLSSFLDKLPFLRTLKATILQRGRCQR